VKFPPLHEENRVKARLPLLREGNRAARPFGSPCEQGEP
jgi:hypothetical protein